MKRLLIAGATLACLMAGGAYATPLGEFDGMFNVKTISTGCNGFPTPGGSGTLMRYLPPGVGGNGTATRITLRDLYQQGTMQNYSLASGTVVGSTLVIVDFVAVDSDARSGKAKVQISSQTPATVVDTTKVVKLAGKIVNFNGALGCTVGFSATLYSY